MNKIDRLISKIVEDEASAVPGDFVWVYVVGEPNADSVEVEVQRVEGDTIYYEPTEIDGKTYDQATWDDRNNRYFAKDIVGEALST